MNIRLGLGFAVLMAATGCGVDPFIPADGGSQQGGDGGTSPVTGGGDGGVSPVDASVPPGCNATKLPTDDACVVNDAQGIFVSSSLGSASGDGSREHPLASLDAALTMANTAQRRVYACAETYAEQIHFQNGTSVFGYFVCSMGWAVGTAHAVVKAPASPVAVASNVSSATRVEAVDLVAPDMTSGSQSSIALIASSSSGLTFVNAKMHAGTGGTGSSGSPAIQLTDSGSAKNGASTIADGVATNFTFALLSSTGQAGGTNVCTGATGYNPGPGGSGGSGGVFQSIYDTENLVWNWVADGAGAVAGNPTSATAQTAGGGGVGVAGATGVSGAYGTDGVSGAAFGVLTATGYAAADGTGGTDAQPGQGGGGAGGYRLTSTDYAPATHQSAYGWGEPGAGGGAGGCPGLAGTPGKGGGASIAVVALQSALTFDNVIIESSAGGAGGTGGLASTPTNGGLGGVAHLHTFGGGSGGAGGLAGVSGNGGGGPSIAIAWHGTMPQLMASTTTAAAGGSGVASRVGPDGKTVPASADGVSAATYSF